LEQLVLLQNYIDVAIGDVKIKDRDHWLEVRNIGGRQYHMISFLLLVMELHPQCTNLLGPEVTIQS
jgi:hypothetical protein